jgi:hypothetical protein
MWLSFLIHTTYSLPFLDGSNFIIRLRRNIYLCFNWNIFLCDRKRETRLSRHLRISLLFLLISTSHYLSIPFKDIRNYTRMKILALLAIEVRLYAITRRFVSMLEIAFGI